MPTPTKKQRNPEWLIAALQLGHSYKISHLRDVLRTTTVGTATSVCIEAEFFVSEHADPRVHRNTQWERVAGIVLTQEQVLWVIEQAARQNLGDRLKVGKGVA